MVHNSNLHTAKSAKNDEFYTKMCDIVNEMVHYESEFKNKVIYCNCDNFNESNFVKYFRDNFDRLGIKKLIATSFNENGNGLWYVLKRELPYEGNGELCFDGSFNSIECINYLQMADIVVTNPPFSKFRQYITLLEQYNKKYIILGNMNAITYKEVFPIIKENRLWLGVSLNGTKCSFIVPESYEGKNVFVEDGVRYAKVNNAIWFTNLDNDKRHCKLELTATYSPSKYPEYFNYNGIDVSRVADIPKDFYGVMGVPITFLHKYNPEQFEIVKFRKGDDDKDLFYKKDGKDIQPYFRILIKRKR